MRQPPQWAADALQTERERCAYHQAGHALAHVTQRLALDGVTVRSTSRQRILWREWSITGATSRSAEPGPSVDERDARTWNLIAVAALAGPEAEAQWLSRTNGAPLDAAREHASANDLDGDLKAADAALRFATWTRFEAQFRAREIVTAGWPAIEEVAAALRDQPRLTGDAVRELAQRHPPI
jgi:hypothetical protein